MQPTCIRFLLSAADLDYDLCCNSLAAYTEEKGAEVDTVVAERKGQEDQPVATRVIEWPAMQDQLVGVENFDQTVIVINGPCSKDSLLALEQALLPQPEASASVTVRVVGHWPGMAREPAEILGRMARHLQALEVSGVMDEQCTASLFSTAGRAARLQRLCLTNCRGVSAALLGGAVSLPTGLRHLDLSVNELAPQAVEGLAAALPRLPHLEHLSLNRCGLGDRGGLVVMRALPAGLRELGAAQNGMGWKALQGMSASVMARLRLLDLRGNLDRPSDLKPFWSTWLKTGKGELLMDYKPTRQKPTAVYPKARAAAAGRAWSL